jgi:hypothetical protein
VFINLINIVSFDLHYLKAISYSHTSRFSGQIGLFKHYLCPVPLAKFSAEDRRGKSQKLHLPRISVKQPNWFPKFIFASMRSSCIKETRNIY